MMTLPGALLRSLAGIVGEPHVLTGDAAAGFAVDWTGRFRGHTPAVVRPGDTAEPYWRTVLRYCADGNLQAVLDEYLHHLRSEEPTVVMDDEHLMTLAGRARDAVSRVERQLINYPLTPRNSSPSRMT